MKKLLIPVALLTAFIALSVFNERAIININSPDYVEKKKKEDAYNGPMQRGLLDMLKTQDPSIGRVPVERLWSAMLETEEVKEMARLSRTSTDLVWEERGPLYDSVGTSNGNGRGRSSGLPQLPGTYTSGRIRAVLVDAGDATGNTVWTGGIAGGLWKTTNFLSASPNWQIVSDFFDNMSISYITQDPSNTDVMYFCTGEATSNSDAVLGKGVWKSTDHGLTWNHLTSTASFTRNFKILCDSEGNVYLASRTSGLRRSTNGGATWTSISPNNLSGVTSSTYCTDIEFAGSRLLASFGYTTSSSGGTIAVRYTPEPATATTADWSVPTGLPTGANRIELAARGDTAYAAPTNSSNNIVAIYRSFNGGVVWEKANLVNYASPVNIANGQGWYNLALEINPVNGSEIMVGGLDAYRSINGGSTMTRATYWINTSPYVHADHHTYKWMYTGGQLRIIMSTDGGLFYSNDNGLTFSDRNKGLAIKQFYSAAIHPQRKDYLLGGTQDNGSHQIKNAGKTYSFEVTGGDGAFVAIDQRDPKNQFTSYTYSQYRRSINDGASFSSFNFSSTRGYFINPFTYDDSIKVLYASYAQSSAPNKKIFRWNNPTTATSVSTSSRDSITINLLRKGTSASNASSFLVSPYTPDRLYVGGHNGSLVRIDGASTVTDADVDSKTTMLTGSSFSTGYINCIAIGASDDELLAVFSNYGVTNLWYSYNGGVSWTGIDGNLPDMPVRWAVFHPTESNKIFIATETGVWSTDMVNGASTEWLPSGNFPTVRTDMLKVRKQDNTIVAATHGRGLWTTTLTVPTVLPVTDITLTAAMQNDGSSVLLWKSYGETPATRFQVEYGTSANDFRQVANVAYNVKTFKHLMSSPVGYYRIVATEGSRRPVYSNVIMLRATAQSDKLQVKVLPNPVTTTASFTLTTANSGSYQWLIVDPAGRQVLAGKGTIAQGGMAIVPLNVSGLAKGVYRLRVIQGAEVVVKSFIKQ